MSKVSALNFGHHHHNSTKQNQNHAHEYEYEQGIGLGVPSCSSCRRSLDHHTTRRPFLGFVTIENFGSKYSQPASCGGRLSLPTKSLLRPWTRFLVHLFLGSLRDTRIDRHVNAFAFM